ncbi:MAG TPA: methyltransferase domain-containing protein [Candidatus Dormibacteraeota bacterium]|nr:methyltransferase domain-containing protein [Candidatus Dormibacteraeota bacterium]
MPPHTDPWRAIDRQPDPERYVRMMESRGRTPTQARLRRRFLRFCGIKPGWDVVEVGPGSGVVARDVAALVGPRGHVTGVDRSRVLLAAARRGAREAGLGRHITWKLGDAARLPLRGGRFDCALAVTVLLHVARPQAMLRELRRVTRPGGVVALQDQDFGTQVLDHPERALTRRIFEGVAARMYPEPFSGRTLVRRLIELGLTRVRLLVDVYQVRSLDPFTHALLQRRAETAVRFGLVSARSAAGWVAAIERADAAGHFVFTFNYYGAAGTKPEPRS